MEEQKNLLEELLNDAEVNVQNVIIGDYTKALLLCRAKMSDVFSSVVNVYDCQYRDEPKEFVEKMMEADEALCKLIGDAVAVSLVESCYKEL